MFIAKEIHLLNKTFTLSYDELLQNDDGKMATVTLSTGQAGRQIRRPITQAWTIFNTLFEYLYTLAQSECNSYTMQDVAEYAKLSGM